jgi:hypothetical protein
MRKREKRKSSLRTTKVINLYAGPGAGKSTAAAVYTRPVDPVVPLPSPRQAGEVVDLEGLHEVAAILQTAAMQQTFPAWHYYECHVTIDPVDGALLKEFTDICKENQFRVAALYMKKGTTLSPSDVDQFCTSRHTQYDVLYRRMLSLLWVLQGRGFVIRRYKIESTLLDSKYDDTIFEVGAEDDR